MGGKMTLKHRPQCFEVQGYEEKFRIGPWHLWHFVSILFPHDTENGLIFVRQ